MSFLDFPGLQYFYNKYLKPIKPHAREETIKSYTVNEQGHVPDAQLVVQLKEENESLQEEIEKLNSALETKQDEFYTSVAPLNEVPFAIQKNMVLISNQIDGANNKSGYFSITDDNRSEWIGLSGLMPQSGTFIGFREVFVKTGTSGSEHIMAKITEMYPLCGRQYFNFYNHGSWVGWTVITPAS